MLLKNISGQPLYFGLTSVLSGFPITDFSGSISGRKALDGGAFVLLSGNIVEDGGGLYHANLHDFDIDADQAGFIFTASGAVPVFYHVSTIGGVSGFVYTASGQHSIGNSGQFVTVPIESISGVRPHSGAFVSVPIASISGVRPHSGASVVATVYSGQLSGHIINLLSGRSFIASGVFATATATVQSGLSVIATVYSGQLSGHQVDLLSGRSWLASGNHTVANSGLRVVAQSGINATASLLSGIITTNSFESGLLTREIPENVLKVDMSGVTGEADRSPLNALRKLMNKFDAGVSNSGKLTVFKEDDSTQAFTQNITSTSGASPITSLDTNN